MTVRMKVLVLLFFLALLSLGACKKSLSVFPTRETPEDGANLCDLIKIETIQSILGSSVTETKSSARSGNGFRVSQCFYAAKDYSLSVNVEIIREDQADSGRRSPRDFWKERFGRSDSEKEEENTGRKNEDEREANFPSPQKIDGIGEDAYWTGGGSAMLYVLNGNIVIRISVGGVEPIDAKLQKSKALAKELASRM